MNTRQRMKFLNPHRPPAMHQRTTLTLLMALLVASSLPHAHAQQAVAESSARVAPISSGELTEAMVKEIVNAQSRQLESLRALLGDMDSDSGESKSANPATAEASSQPANKGALSTGGLGSSRLQTGSLQGSGRIYGYTPLPDVAPVSSILFPTPAQLAYKAEITRRTLERKKFLRTNPTPYNR